MSIFFRKASLATVFPREEFLEALLAIAKLVNPEATAEDFGAPFVIDTRMITPQTKVFMADQPQDPVSEELSNALERFEYLCDMIFFTLDTEDVWGFNHTMLLAAQLNGFTINFCEAGEMDSTCDAMVSLQHGGTVINLWAGGNLGTAIIHLQTT